MPSPCPYAPCINRLIGTCTRPPAPADRVPGRRKPRIRVLSIRSSAPAVLAGASPIFGPGFKSFSNPLVPTVTAWRWPAREHPSGSFGDARCRRRRKSGADSGFPIEDSGACANLGATVGVCLPTALCFDRPSSCSSPYEEMFGEICGHRYLYSVLHTCQTLVMMMSFICSCRNRKEEPISIYTFRKVRTIRGCLEGLTLMI